MSAATIPVAHQAKLYADQLRFSDSVVQMLLKGFPHDRWFHQPSPTDNHIMWCLGHLARSNEWFTSMLNGATPALPESYKGLFGFGSVPTNNPSLYPEPEEILAAYSRTLAVLVKAIEACTDFDAKAEIDTQGFVENKAQAAMRSSWHIGHMSSARRALGLPSAFA